MITGPTKLLDILWKRGYFIEERMLTDIEKEMKNLGFSFDLNSIFIAAKRSDFLTKKENEAGKYYTQKYPSQTTFEEANSGSLFDSHNFHPKIVRASKSLFETEHYAEAVFAAFKAIEIYVKEKSKTNGLFGQKLMMDVFNSSNPKLKINSLQSDSEKDEQEGYKFIFAGVMRGIKDPKSHSEIIQNPERTLQLLSLAHLLMQIVDTSIPNS